MRLLVYTTLFVCVLLFARPRLRAARPGTGLELLGVVMAVGGLVTVLLNSDALRYGPVTVQAMPLEETPTNMSVVQGRKMNPRSGQMKVSKARSQREGSTTHHMKMMKRGPRRRSERIRHIVAAL